MSTTLAKLRYNLLNLKSGGRDSDDDWLSPRQVDYIISYTRSILIRRDYEKKRFVDPNLIQDLGCVEMELIDSAECCDVESGCQLLRSVLPIPNFIQVHNGNLATYVGLVDKKTNIDLIPIARSRWINNNKYTKGLRRAYFLGQYLYVINDKMLEYVNVRGVFDDPVEAAKFNHCTGEPCFTDDSDYPVSAWMIGAMTSMILSGEVKESLIVPKDTQNDSSGDQK